MGFVKLICVLILGASWANAQIVSGTITGSVKDASGGAIPGAQVSAVNENTNFNRETRSNEAGDFNFANLPPGRYRVTASHPGFKSGVVANIELLIDQTARADLKLEVGQINEQVTVQGSAVLLDTDTPTIGQVIEQKPIQDLPLNGRNFLQLASLSAGVIPATANTTETARLGPAGSSRSQLTAHVGGARGSFNSFLLDGMENRGSRFGEMPFLPSLDAVQEFKIQRNFYSAEYGQSVGIVSLSIKSGTNGLHGSVYEYLRNSDFDARQFFDGPGPAPFRQNQFGASLGGPIRRDKTFFFGSYEGRRQSQSTQGFATVPSPQNLSGIFSAPITDPFNNNAPFPNNVIPTGRISNLAAKYNQFIPAPNTNLPQGNYTGAPATTDNFDQFHIRVDHRFSQADSLFARYSQSDWNIVQQALLPYRGNQYPLNAKNAVVEETRVFGPATVNTIKLGFSRSFLGSEFIPADHALVNDLGFKNLVPLSLDYSLTGVTIPGISALGYNGNTFRQWTNNYAISDTLSLTRGRHNLSTGVDVRRYRAPNITTNGSNGSLVFSTRFTGNGLADYLLGAYTSGSALSFTSERDYRFSDYALFVQDDFKVNSRLTLNLGVRWEYDQNWRDKSGAEGYFDQSIGALRLAHSPSYFGFNITAPWIVVGGVRDGVMQPRFDDFAPRVGFAYRITDNTVLRGGYGIFYAMNQSNDTSIGVNPGASVTVSVTNSPGQIPRLADTLFDNAVAAVTSASNSISTVDENRKTPYMQQWNFNIERSIKGIAIEAGYLGSKGTHLLDRLDLNQAALNLPGQNLPVQSRRPYQQFQNILGFLGDEISNYNAGTLRVERRFAHGFAVLANYTVSKSLDTGSRSIDDGASPHPITSNRFLEYAPSAFDVRHRFVSSVIWELPFGKGKPWLSSATGVAGRVIGGWQLNTIIALQTGNPFSITESGDQSNTGVQATERPNRVGNGILPDSQKSPNRWFDTSAYVINALNTWGNAGRNTVWQDGVKDVDLSLFKNNYFGERYNLQFRAEFFNVLNNVNFGRPGQTINGANFGVVNSTGPARQIQLALRLQF